MSTSHALIDLVEEISTSLDKKKYTLGEFIDLKKAFNTVNHSVLTLLLPAVFGDEPVPGRRFSLKVA